MSAPLIRHPKNPILTPAQMPVACSAVFNAGADTRMCLAQTSVAELLAFCKAHA